MRGREFLKKTAATGAAADLNSGPLILGATDKADRKRR